jgi:hypothetical protein
MQAVSGSLRVGLLLLATPVKFYEGAEAGFFFAGEFGAGFVVQGAKEISFVFGETVELDFTGLTAEFFELVQALFVHSAVHVM